MGLLLGGSTSCGGSSLPASSSASSISSCAGHASGRTGRLLRQSPSSSAEEVLALASSAMCASSSSGCSVLGIAGDSEEELWIETASFASSSAIAASVTAREVGNCPSCTSCSSFSGSRSEIERTSGVRFGRGQLQPCSKRPGCGAGQGRIQGHLGLAALSTRRGSTPGAVLQRYNPAHCAVHVCLALVDSAGSFLRYIVDWEKKA